MSLHFPIPTADTVDEFGESTIGCGTNLGCFCWIFVFLMLGIPVSFIIARTLFG